MEVGAQVVFDCEVCGWEVEIELGGPGVDHWEHTECPNPSCNAEWDTRVEVEPLQNLDGTWEE